MSRPKAPLRGGPLADRRDHRREDTGEGLAHAATLASNTPGIASASIVAVGIEEPYQLLAEIGRGGLGKVSRALDKRLARQVAIKELLQSQGNARARFLQEALITAKLQHPSIIPIYEMGARPSGELFYSMKMVTGDTLESVLARTPSLQDRLALLPRLLDVCEAISYAHTFGVIHRDLKPQNILLGEFGETVVIDWGLAKELSSSLNDAREESKSTTGEVLTQSGSVMGTPAYMPPEQAHLEGA